MEIRAVYYLTTFVLVVGAITMIALPLRTYVHTRRRAMIHLSLGFALITAAALATTISTRLMAFHDADGLLIVHNGLTASGILLVIYSLIAYQ